MSGTYPYSFEVLVDLLLSETYSVYPQFQIEYIESQVEGLGIKDAGVLTRDFFLSLCAKNISMSVSLLYTDEKGTFYKHSSLKLQQAKEKEREL